MVRKLRFLKPLSVSETKVKLLTHFRASVHKRILGTQYPNVQTIHKRYDLPKTSQMRQTEERLLSRNRSLQRSYEKNKIARIL